ncbi:MAG: hypothetical protein NC253_15025 [Ruminococcus sp.]|nr:hypothetical protein [Ruminococcus sp.]MCM1382083.1 hypothetical protein [Muribaculaceae bacterium]
MIIRMDAWKAMDIMEYADRKRFTFEALSRILDFYDANDENTEFDPYYICRKWHESSSKDFIGNNRDILEELNLDSDKLNLSDDEEIAMLINKIRNSCHIQRLNNGNILILQ